MAIDLKLKPSRMLPKTLVLTLPISLPSALTGPRRSSTREIERNEEFMWTGMVLGFFSVLCFVGASWWISEMDSRALRRMMRMMGMIFESYQCKWEHECTLRCDHRVTPSFCSPTAWRDCSCIVHSVACFVVIPSPWQTWLRPCSIHPFSSWRVVAYINLWNRRFSSVLFCPVPLLAFPSWRRYSPPKRWRRETTVGDEGKRDD